MLRRGYLTTEFWISALTIVGLVVSSAATSLPPRYAAIGSSIAAAAYAIARGLAKLNPPKDEHPPPPPVQPVQTVRPFTSEEAERIAEACSAYLEAHERRSHEAQQMTYRESSAVGVLVYELAAREREALKAAMGSAA